MIAHGELCAKCINSCVDKPSQENEIEVEQDEGGTFFVNECPRRFCSGIVDAVNLSQLADKHLPVSGGVMDQASWWVDCWMALKADMNRIEVEKQQREARRGRR